MKKCNLTEEQLIDFHYGELKDEIIGEHIKKCVKCQEYLMSLSLLDNQLNVFGEVNSQDMTISDQVALNNVFARAEAIERKQAAKETLLFGGLALSLFTLLIYVFNLWDLRYFIYFEVILYLLIPFIVLPLLKNQDARGHN